MIVVRDRREKLQFSVHNRLIDEWFPIIGPPGFALYCLYTRLANRVDERAFPGFRLIRDHFGFSMATVANYNRLLVFCGLISVNRGDERRPNEYYILEIPEVDAVSMGVLVRRVNRRLGEVGGRRKQEERFWRMILARVDAWKPIQALWWSHGRKQVTVVTRAQLEMDLGGASPSEAGASRSEAQSFIQGSAELHPGKRGASPSEAEQSELTIRKEQSETDKHAAVVDILVAQFGGRGVNESDGLALIDEFGVEQVERQLNWLSYRLTDYMERGKRVDNVPGFLVRAIQENWAAPASALVE